MALAWALGAAPAQASPGVTLDQYRATPNSDDAFVTNRPQVPGHLRVETRLSLDYSKNPLLFQQQASVNSSKKIALVSDQLVADVGASIGLFDDFLAFAALPINLVLSGKAWGAQPTATGAGAGDLRFGARGVFYRAGDSGALGLQLEASLPTGAGSGFGPAVAGDAGPTLQPSLLAELSLPVFSVTANAGVRIRKQVGLPPVSVGDQLTYALAFTLHIIKRQLDTSLEAFGVTPADDVGRRASSPLEALLGVKLRLSALTLGLSSGVGVLGGYGAPDFRVAALGAYRFGENARKAGKPPVAAAPAEPIAPPPTAATEPEPVAIAPGAEDRDGDGLEDADDQCPAWAGPADAAGCPLLFQYMPENGALALQTPISWRGQSATLADDSTPVLAEVAAALAKNHDRVIVLAHVPPRGNPVQSLKLSSQRAQAIVQWLQAHGVTSTQLEAYGCAGNRPIASAHHKDRAKNERVELFVTRPLPKLGMPATVGCDQVAIVPASADNGAQLPSPAPPPTAAKPAPATSIQPALPPAALPPAALPAAPPPQPIQPAPAHPHSHTIGASRPRGQVQRSLEDGVQSE